ncbi:hypothetical protein K402DRAFT_394141 [Aulographum hederae CBS 113979]|uniref:Uncharacterized protein n=1 Tax=Aulographum hederae CBS 113979 TaxID=1176131 RepID=A0A6G1GY55_9PEZI|nr:hypothetical protein K402DRAFT_394141 [Aulographum hederae CBS 113979]
MVDLLFLLLLLSLLPPLLLVVAILSFLFFHFEVAHVLLLCPQSLYSHFTIGLFCFLLLLPLPLFLPHPFGS